MINTDKPTGKAMKYVWLAALFFIPSAAGLAETPAS